MNRRELMCHVGASAIATSLTIDGAHAQPASGRTGMGLVTYCCSLRRKDSMGNAHDLFEPQTFLEHCQRVGAGGAQLALGVMEVDQCHELRDWASRRQMYIEAIISVPKDSADCDRFEEEVKTASEAGALAARTTIIPGRRYEQFNSLEEFRQAELRGKAALQLAAPIVEKYKLPLAVENHKDHRNDERVALLEFISSEYVGACVDTGNSIALLEDPLETVRKLAPWARSVHIKDQALAPYDDGFLLADIPLGRGYLDLRSMVEILLQQHPQIRFSLELITRDPLQIPVFTQKYWATLPDLPGENLARTLRQVRDHPARNLQYVSSRNLREQVAAEDDNIRMSLEFAAKRLGI